MFRHYAKAVCNLIVSLGIAKTHGEIYSFCIRYMSCAYVYTVKYVLQYVCTVCMYVCMYVCMCTKEGLLLH